jgi:hypothetical protein
MDFIRQTRPHQATFVPDSEDQFTSDHGWSFPQDAERLKPLIAECKALGVRVSLFMDPIPEQMAAAKAVGADRVELYTEPFAANWGKPSRSSNCKPMPGPRRPRWMRAWASMPAMTSIATTWPPLWPGCRVWPKSPSATR